jgi:DNA repair exonuclease SbcCD ATPase subunit
MTDGSDKKASELEAEFRKLVIDELKSISSKQDESTKSLNDLTTEFKLHKQESQNRWETIAKLDAEQNAILSEHAARSEALQKQNELTEKSLRAAIFGEGIVDPEQREHTVVGRIEKLEEPRRFMKNLKKIAIAVGAIITALATLYGLFQAIVSSLK